jgi:hypothetical protein
LHCLSIKTQLHAQVLLDWLISPGRSLLALRCWLRVQKRLVGCLLVPLHCCQMLQHRPQVRLRWPLWLLCCLLVQLHL